MVCNEQCEDDAQVLGLVKELASVGVTADQLGAPEDFAIPLPAAVCCFIYMNCTCERKGAEKM
jgi:hypothetical protein